MLLCGTARQPLQQPLTEENGRGKKREERDMGMEKPERGARFLPCLRHPA